MAFSFNKSYLESSMKKILDNLFPDLAKFYRRVRDKRIVSMRKFRATKLGFDFIGVESMPESRIASGEVGLLQRYLAQADQFIDVGANCGFYTLIACKAGVPVICFEPNAENYQFILKNLHHNKFTAEAFQIALSNEPAVLELFGGGEGASLVPNWGGMRNTYAQLVCADTLDNLLSARFGKNNLFIKIDAEGHEFEILTGAAKLLKQSSAPIWLIEHGLTENYEVGINPNFMQLFEIFWQEGYQSFTSCDKKLTVVRADVERWIANSRRDFGGINYLFIKP